MSITNINKIIKVLSVDGEFYTIESIKHPNISHIGMIATFEKSSIESKTRILSKLEKAMK